ncbi:MAG: Wzz/FepE/Etk N-terminal domain-containing protein, partial [Chloroflexia bacterium]
VVLKRKWLILSLAVVVTSLVAIQMYRLPSIYEATTTIQIEQRNRSVLQSRDLVINAPSDPAYWSTQLKLIENPELARQVILTLDLQNNPAFLGGQSRSFLSALRRAFRGERPPPQVEAGVPVLSEGELDFGEKLSVEQLERLEPYEDTLRANLVVDPTEKTSLVDIRYQHPNPEIAMRVADALAAVFILRDNVRETQGTTKAAEALAREIADLQTKIRENEAARLSYMIGSNLPLNEAKGQNLTAERLGMLSSQLLTAENELKNFTAALRRRRPQWTPKTSGRFPKWSRAKAFSGYVIRSVIWKEALGADGAVHRRVARSEEGRRADCTAQAGPRQDPARNRELDPGALRGVHR